MGFYIVISAIMGILLLLENIGAFSLKTCRNLSYFILVVFFILSSIRWEVGTDWDSYYHYFKGGGSIASGWIGDFEIGYRVATYIVRLFTDNYVVMNTIWAFSVLVCGLLFVKQIYGTISRNYQNEVTYGQIKIFRTNSVALFKSSPMLTIVACFWFLYFGNIFFTRATLAMVLQLVSIEYAERKQVKKFLLIILLATLIHRTSIVFLFVYPIINCNWAIFKKFQWFSIFLAGIMAIFGKKIIYYIGAFMPPSVQYRLKVYSNSFLEVGLFGIINTVILLALFIMFSYRFARGNRRYINLVKIYSFALVPYAVGITFNGYFIRMAYPYMLVQIILIPKCIQFIKGSAGRFAVSLLLIIYLCMRLLSNLGTYDVFIPFKTIFC